MSDSSPQPKVLVGIVTHNRASVLPKAIQSGLAQRYSNLQIAVLDDGSRDGTPTLQRDFPTVSWLRWDAPRGYLEARNHLMRNGRTKYYISLDDDAWFLDQDEIGLAIEYMELNAQVGAVAFDILSPDRPAAVPRSTPRPTSTFIGCGHLLRLSALEECGFYTPSPGPYGAEEKDLCLRLLDRRWDVHLLPGVHVWHDKSSVARDEAGQHRSGVCNDLVFALRRCPLPLMMAVLPAKIASHLGFAMRKRLVKPCVQGLVLFFRNSAAVWQSRKPVRSGTFGEFVRRSHEA